MDKNYDLKSVLVIVGEKSGEEHFLSFYDDLKKKLPNVHFYGVGGDTMGSKGVELIYNLKDFGSIGFTEVVAKIPFYFKASKNLLQNVRERNTKVAILVDFQEFNFQIAKKLKKSGVEVLYFVAPQAWAWRSYRAKILGKIVNTLFTIFPFEKEFFTQRGVKRVVGILHPVLHNFKNELKNFEKELEEKRNLNFLKNNQTNVKILLLPGSRRSEIEKLLPVFFDSLAFLKKEKNILFEVGIVKADSIPKEYFDFYLGQNKIVGHFFNSSELSKSLIWADLCIASSGTVTLSCALFEVPTVICYKISKLTSLIYGLIVRYQGPIGLPNIVLQKIVYPELLQDNVNPIFISKIIQYLLTEHGVYEKIKKELMKVSTKLSGDEVPPYEVMAKVVLETYEKDH